jgi:hypothetical protein
MDIILPSGGVSPQWRATEFGFECRLILLRRTDAADLPGSSALNVFATTMRLSIIPWIPFRKYHDNVEKNSPAEQV